MSPTATPLQQRQPKQLVRSKNPGTGGIGSASTPNLNSLYTAHSRLTPSAGALARKASYAALTPGSLAAIPDDSESYAHSVLNESPTSPRRMAPLTPGRGGAGDDFALGDTVDVPGNMYGTIRFVGSVGGRKGTFAGVELHSDFAGRGKNSGDVDGVSYFTTHTPGAGIFVPVSKLFKRASSSAGASSALKIASQNTTNFTPPTPSIPQFSKSMGPGRATSPAGKRPRVSLPRPESPVRRLQLNPATRPTIATPATKGPPRYGSPSLNNKFAQSVRGTAGDPNKLGSRIDRKPSVAPRSASALGPMNFDDDEPMPLVNHTQTNGSIGSIASLKMRPASRAAHANEEEIERLKTQLEDRDRQLKEQASALAEMESSVTELTSLMEHSDMGRQRSDSHPDKDTSQLRAMLREKNEKIAMLTAEFDAHRADFRSTIDTLEMASTETQRVYDARIRELEQEIHDYQDRADDVDSVARQLKQLEELVQELEEGLEDARRGEAEARGEVEFLRGEVERTRSELRREREKASASANGTANGGDVSKELEKKEDEIRGLKAIIHSLSRDSLPGTDSPDRTPTQLQRNLSFTKSRPESIETRMAREKLEREVHELRALVDNKNSREEELEREVEALRRGSATSAQRISSLTIGSTGDRSSYRDSKGTVILAREPRSPEHKRVATLDTMPESDAYSSVTESSTLWCEICETGGHDILTCTNMFGDQKKSSSLPAVTSPDPAPEVSTNLNVPGGDDDDFIPRPLTPVKPTPASVPAPTNVKILPNPTDSGPLAGKDSGVIDPEKWCALCERDGHESIDCPLEDAF
ncbi:uncharacterized protein BCR38DRAFT_350602 [Pseudomassariella vexata]|uniref:CAP-Gly domain-containing protein n=1 Tax=Pseudomassariella vexata TaxID=1141098 RepID=A0A1Y2DLT7_9PEZI|nr:uncharacterized protein BCR38DRAFT_350602 [Pseudomassariella vexata]ORY60181.1 hypothetical protein BCR38DRAFT_350602 [Pseudomassariella vexata]